MKAICSIQDCDGPAAYRGWCNGHYQRWRRYGHPLGGGPMHRPRGMPVAEVVEWELARATPDGDCLLAAHTPNYRGYATTSIGGRTRRIHRAVLEHHLCRKLTADEAACHRCHRRLCINPNHLYVGSHQRNMADMATAGRGRSGQRKGANNSNARFTGEQVADMRRKAAAGITQAALARDYQTSSSTISRIVRRLGYS